MMDYEGLAKSRLVGRISQKPLVEALISALPKQLAILELVFDQLKNERSIDTAIGIQLDKLGEIVGELRLGRSDDEYRRALRIRVFINISKGRPSDLIYALKEITQASKVQYFESYPAAAWLYTNGYEASQDIQKNIQDVSPAGIFDVPISVSFGETPLRLLGVTSSSAKLGRWRTLDNRRMKTLSGKTILLNPGSLDGYGMGGIQLGVFTTLAGARLMTLNGKRIRMKQNKRVVPSYEKLTGVYQA